MSSTFRALETTGNYGGDGPAIDSVSRAKPAAWSRDEGQSQIYKTFHHILLLYVFMYVSRIPELVPWLRIGFLLQPLLLVGLFMTGETGVLTRARSTRWLIAFTVWVAICVPFSFWPGGSFATLVKTAQSLLLVAFVLAFVQSFRDVMRILAAVGLASSAIAVMSFVSSADINNRQGLGGSASLADPNFYALYLLVGLAFLGLTASYSRGFVRFCWFALMPLNLVGILRSGSRAGLVTLLVGLVLFLAFGSARQRTVLLSAGLAGVLLAGAFLPSNIKARFIYWFAPSAADTYLLPGSDTSASGDYEAERGLASAQASTEARMYLLQRSLILTAKHPILGVGPDQFQSAEAEDAGLQNVKGAWHYTHNTYTQVSSECGIPGLILFGGALIWAYSGLSRVRRRGPSKMIRQTAVFIQVAFMMLMVGAFFLSLGYGGLPFLMIAFTEVFKRVAARHTRELHLQRVQPELSAAV